MATLTVTESTDYSVTSLTNIGTIDFVNTADAATATFSRSQFGAGLIRNNVLIDGSSAANVIAVVGGTINASAWQFANWRDVADSVVLTGSDNPETIVGSSRGDAIEGKGGDDELSGGDGNDRIRGGGGNDIIDGGTGRNILYGGLGNDTLTGGSERNDLYGQDGDDLISSFYRGAIDGGTGTDRLTLVRQPGSANLTIDISLGGEGADIGDGTMIAGIESFFVQSGVGNDTVRGGDLADWIETGKGNDILDGGGGNDTLLSGAGDDEVSGGSGDDTLAGGTGEDTVTGGSGNDTVTATGSGSFDGGEGMDVLYIFRTGASGPLALDLMAITEDMGDGTRVEGFEELRYEGGDGVDVVSGGELNDRIHGGYGDDIIDGGGGRNRLYGGLGLNTLSYVNAKSAMTVWMDDGVASDGYGTRDKFSLFRNVLGSAFDDRVYGDKERNTLDGGDGGDQLLGYAAADLLFGGAGKDSLGGYDGDDRLNGGSGQDFMNGGAGLDIFAFTAASDSETGLSRDWIGDFAAGTDIIDLSAIDADETGGTANDGFSFVAGAGTPFVEGVPGQVRFEFAAGNTIISINTDADADAESQIELYGEINLSAGDFLL